MKADERVLALAWTRLSQTRICVACEAVFVDDYRACPACTSEQVMPLATWLGTIRQ